MRVFALTLTLLLSLCFGLAARLAPWHEAWSGGRGRSANVLAALLGDSRRMFANHFFVKADAYFHSGYYPTVFDNRESHQTAHMAADAGAAEDKNAGDEHSFLGKPRDWIDRFSRSFFPAEHTHLDEGGAQVCKHDHSHGHGHAHDHAHHHEDASGGDTREILPWLRVSAELDPHRVETYTVAAFWLRTRLKKVNEAEQFLREGWKANPDSPEILLELGRLLYEDRRDVVRARNVLEAALTKWRTVEARRKEPNVFVLQQILGQLAKLEREQGNISRAIAHLEALKQNSPAPDSIQQQINELKPDVAASASPPKP
jgi:tetratricopeptide (TPR) repeat protein